MQSLAERSRFSGTEENSTNRWLVYIPLTSVIVVYALTIYVITRLSGLEAYFRIGLYSSVANLFVLSLIVVANGLLVFLALRTLYRLDEKPLLKVARDFGSLVGMIRIAELMIPLFLISLYNSVFTSFKSIIGVLNPFNLDPLLSIIDRVFHGGVDPWQITHAIVSSPSGTLAVDLCYTAWLIVMWCFLCWQMLRINRPFERHQFFLSYVLCWTILGSVLAYLLSSAGPCYYGFLYNADNLYVPLMERLQHAREEVMSYGNWQSIRALDGQSYLWNNRMANGVVPGGGISAMPSLHVSMAVLFALSAWQVSRLFGVLMAIYVLVILFGSVHLGWHYAIDGYLAIPVTIIIWYLSGRIIKRFYKVGYNKSR